MASFQALSCDADQFEHSYFSALKGNWVGDGELMNSDGVAATIHEEWSAEVEDDRFLIRGTRLSGGGTQEFHWTFVFNASTEFFECEYWHTGMDNKMIFEVSLSDNKAELRTPFGEAGGELLVSNSVKENVIESNVAITNGNGETFPLASVKHTRKKK